MINDHPEEVAELVGEAGHSDDEARVMTINGVGQLGEVGRVDVLGEVLEEARYHEVKLHGSGQGLQLERGAEKIGDEGTGLQECQISLVEEFSTWI